MTAPGACKKGRLPRSFRPRRLAAVLALVLVALALAPTLRHLWDSNGSVPVRISKQEASVQVPPSVAWLQPPAEPSTRSLNLLLVGHELSLTGTDSWGSTTYVHAAPYSPRPYMRWPLHAPTGAPGSFLEVGQNLREKGHNITFVFLKDGDLEPAVQQAGFAYSFIPNLRTQPRLHA